MEKKNHVNNDGISLHVLGEHIVPGSTKSEFICVKMPSEKAITLSRETKERVFEVEGKQYYYMGLSNTPMNESHLRPWKQAS